MCLCNSIFFSFSIGLEIFFFFSFVCLLLLSYLLRQSLIYTVSQVGQAVKKIRERIMFSFLFSFLSLYFFSLPFVHDESLLPHLFRPGPIGRIEECHFLNFHREELRDSLI